MTAPFPRRQPLPQNPFNQAKDTLSYDAYQYCLANEIGAYNEKRLVYARLLGYLLKEDPGADARVVLAHEILACQADGDCLDILAEFYTNHLIRLFKQNKGRTPATSDDPSPLYFEVHQDSFADAIEEPPKDHSAAKRSALKRDNYCCMVTGLVDCESSESMTDAEEQIHGLVGRATVSTDFCYIFPSINWNLMPGERSQSYSENVWAIINGFGGADVLAELDGTNMHRLSNGLTMRQELHTMFDDLSLWFEEVANSPHTYNVCTIFPNHAALSPLPHPRTVTFATATGLDLPDARYLRVHAAICRVAQLSGAVQYVNSYDLELETSTVLAFDGSSSELLSSQLRRTFLVVA